MLAPKPLAPFFSPPKPAPRRLPERKRMTIALGLLAKNGLVLAADTQETYGNGWKVSQAKIIPGLSANASKHGRNHIAVAGAGSGDYIDSLARKFINAFADTSKSPHEIFD